MMDTKSPNFSNYFFVVTKKPIMREIFNFLLIGFTLILSSLVCLLGMKAGGKIVCTLLMTRKHD